ncbi:MAG: hypothetical protein GXO10_06625 [Crenarchaeota archaeon]|nr:hypothetical protein [Thermoproteota archaeon]
MSSKEEFKAIVDDRVQLYGLLMTALGQDYESIVKMPEFIAIKLLDWKIKQDQELAKKMEEQGK